MKSEIQTRADSNLVQDGARGVVGQSEGNAEQLVFTSAVGEAISIVTARNVQQSRLVINQPVGHHNHNVVIPNAAPLITWQHCYYLRSTNSVLSHCWLVMLRT